MSEYQQTDEQSKISLQINFVSTNVFQIIKIFINFELIIVAAKNKMIKFARSDDNEVIEIAF